MDVVQADAQIDAFIERRSRREPTPDELEPSYAESVKVYNAAREAERRAAWSDYHRVHAERLRRTLEPLIALHEARAAALCEEVPRGCARMLQEDGSKGSSRQGSVAP